ncbi:MAG: hypothetical protein SA339_04470 [Methanomassiliicoccus sp.]|nr:hypothetical protein [Methanomassiliicoccus sp.]
MGQGSKPMVGVSEDQRLHRYFVLLGVLSFVIMTAAVLVVYNNPMSGYEYSVYESTPLIFWLAVIFCQLTGILLFYTYYGTKHKLWAVGLFEIILSNFVLISLYLIKGFIYIERTDSLSYVGYAKDIFASGFFSASNFYPYASIIMAMTGDIIGQGMILMSQIFPAIFFTAYTVGILCWSRTIIPKPMYVTSMMLASMPIFFAWFIPTLFNETLSVLLLPLFFFVLWKCQSGDWRFKVPLVLFVIFFTIGHPLVAMFAIIFLAIVAVTEKVTAKKTRSVSIYMALFGFALLFGWIVFHSTLVVDLQNIIKELMVLGEGTSTFANASAQASEIGLLSTLQSVLVCTIDDLIYAVIALAAAVYVLRRGWRTHIMTVLVALFIIGGVFLAGIVLFTYTHNPYRLINLDFIIIFTIPLVGFVLYTLRSGGRKNLHRLVSLVIVLCLVSTVYTVYQDPNSRFPNASVTKAETVGSNWLITDKSDDFTLFTVQTSPWRYTNLLYGASYTRGEGSAIQDNDITTGAHFSSFLNFNDTATTAAYLVITTYEEMAYTKAWAATEKQTASDFQGLEYQRTVGHVYEGGDMTVYMRSR